MNQKIIDKTLAMNLFEESKKSSNWFVVEYMNTNVSKCYFTENIPFHYFQYVCLALTYSWLWTDVIGFYDKVHSQDNIIDHYNREQKIDNFSVLNCLNDTLSGAFSRFWMKTKVGKNLNICNNFKTINVMTKFPDEVKQSFSFDYNTFNKKFNRFGDTKTKHKFIPILSKYEINLLVEFSKLWLVKK